VLDVWEGEPNLLPGLLETVDIGTPHIAGYSFDGKVNGTRMIYEAACQFFHLPATWTPQLPAPPVPRVETTVAAGEDEEDVLRRVIRQVYDINGDDAALRKVGSAGFDKLRTEYPVRREFFNTELILSNAGDSFRRKFAALGFRLA
jgi:erythronate-4-phosphate dehydrogenase